MLYDVKSEQEIQDVVVKDVSEIVLDIVREYKALRYGEIIAVYAPYEIVYDIADLLCDSKDTSFYLDEDSDSIDGKPSEDDGLLSIECDGGLLVEPARGDDHKFKSSFSTLCYFYDRYKEDDMRQILFTEERILVFGFEDESKCENKESKKGLDTQVFKDNNGLHGFEFSKMTENGSCYYAFYTNQSLSEKFYKEVAEILK